MNKRSERRKRCALAVGKAEPKIFAPPQTPFPGRRTAKIESAGDGHYLHLQTQFGEDRCTQFRVIVVTVPQSHQHTKTGDRLQYTAPLASAQCNDVYLIGRRDARR